MAEWRHATDCNSVYVGSIPARDSKNKRPLPVKGRGFGRVENIEGNEKERVSKNPMLA